MENIAKYDIVGWDDLTYQSSKKKIVGWDDFCIFGHAIQLTNNSLHQKKSYTIIAKQRLEAGLIAPTKILMKISQ